MNYDQNRYGFDFYNVPCKELANQLLGKYLVRRMGPSLLKGKIVETECYLGFEDKASHSFQGKVTERNEPMYMPPGTCYVYFTYGMYHCFNISSQGDGAAVLIRALEPVEGIDVMRENRCKFLSKRNKEGKKDFKLRELCNGPAKLCISFQIDSDCNKKDLCTWNEMWIEDHETISDHFIVDCPRIGIESSGVESASLPLRFYIFKSVYVSKSDKKKETIKFSV